LPAPPVLMTVCRIKCLHKKRLYAGNT